MTRAAHCVPHVPQLVITSYRCCCSKPAVGQKFLATRRSVRPERRNSVVVPKASMEVAQVAVDTGLIFGSGAVMVGITLVVRGYPLLEVFFAVLEIF